MKITADEAERIVYGDHDDWEEIRGTEEIVEQDRWSTTFSAVWLHKPSQKYYSAYYTRGSTEVQEGMDLFPEDPDFYEVECREVTEKKWMPVE